MEEKLRFVFEYERDELTMRELCEQFEISRETGYLWLRRYRAYGVKGMEEADRAPRRHPNQTPAELEQAILQLRQAHMRWGPRKLKRILQRDEPGRRWPATSTIGEIVKRAGLVVARKRRRKTEPYSEPLAHASEANRVWCADFKGWWRAQDGQRIDPLTITDAWSRYLVRCQAVEKTDTERVRAIFEAAFREYGMPQAIRTDNGAPFASTAIAGLSRWAVWWLKLGIVPERIEPGKPQQNGRHERMHRTLQQEVVEPAESRRAQQLVLDRFRKEYNEVRPHEALGMQTPSQVYVASSREYPRRVPEVEYPEAMKVLTVKSHGHFRWKHHDVFLSEALSGERIGLLSVDERWFTIYFVQVPLARFDSRFYRLEPLPKDFDVDGAGEEDQSPSPATPSPETKEKVSGMCPV